MSFYLNTSVSNVDFQNTAQTVIVDIGTNGTVVLSEDLSWITSSLQYTNVRADSETDGLRNSDVINTFEQGSFAAQIARDYRDVDFPGVEDWYLPASEQMDTLVNNPSVFPDHALAGTEYWTSTEDYAQSAILVLTSGIANSTAKTEVHSIRAIRQVSYSTVNAPYSIGDNVGHGIVFDVDTSLKITYIVAREDAADGAWGSRTEIANANFASSLTLVSKVSDRYIVNSGVATLTIEESADILAQIVLTQDPATQDSTSVFLKDVVSNIMVKNMNERSFAYGIETYEALLHGKRLMQEMGYNGINEVRFYEGKITAANKFVPPFDMVGWNKLSIVTTEGYLMPLFVNKNLNVSFTFVEDIDGNIITDNEGYPIKAQGSRRDTEAVSSNIPTSATIYRGYSNRGLPGMTGGQVSSTGTYRYDEDANEFIVDGIPQDYEVLVLEYLSDPILSERNSERLRIHKYYQNAIEKGIYYYFIEPLRDVPSYEKERARKEYYNEFRIAKRRHRIKAQELVQKLGANVGFNKTL